MLKLNLKTHLQLRHSVALSSDHVNTHCAAQHVILNIISHLSYFFANPELCLSFGALKLVNNE